MSGTVLPRGEAFSLIGSALLLIAACAAAMLSACLPYAGIAFASDGIVDEAVPYAISERIGEVIDAQERGYFGMFPDVELFVEARTYKNANGEILMDVQRQGTDSLVTSRLVLGTETAGELQKYVENLEPLIRGEVTVRQGMISHIATVPDKDLVREGLPAVVATADGHEWAGELLYVSPEILLLWSGTSYKWGTTDAHIKAIAPSDVKYISVKEHSKVGPYVAAGGGGGFALGLAIMGGIDGSNREDPPENMHKYCARDYLIVSGICAGVGAVGGWLYGLSKSGRGEYTINSDPANYQKHFQTLKGKAVFGGDAPPEIRRYEQAARAEAE